MTTVLGVAATAITVAGLICLLSAAAFTRSWHAGLRMALDLWVAASLLRLTAAATATDLLVAATIIGVRQLLTTALRSSGSFAQRYRQSTERTSR